MAFRYEESENVMRKMSGDINIKMN